MAKGTFTMAAGLITMDSLEVEQSTTGAVAGAFKVDNNDTDKQAIVVEAANIDADVMDVTMDAVTTAKGIDITADGLTTGSALYIDSDSSSTSTRSIASVIQNHSSASGSTTLYLQNDHATADALLAKGAVTVGVDGTGHDVKFFGDTAGQYMRWDQTNDSLELMDDSKLKFGDGADFSLWHDGSHSYIRNEVGTLKIATEVSGIAVTIGHTTSETTVADNLTVTGNISVSGTGLFSTGKAIAMAMIFGG